MFFAHFAFLPLIDVFTGGPTGSNQQSLQKFSFQPYMGDTLVWLFQIVVNFYLPNLAVRRRNPHNFYIVYNNRFLSKSEVFVCFDFSIGIRVGGLGDQTMKTSAGSKTCGNLKQTKSSFSFCGKKSNRWHPTIINLEIFTLHCHRSQYYILNTG